MNKVDERRRLYSYMPANETSLTISPTLLMREKWMSKVGERRGPYSYMPSSETSLIAIYPHQN